MFFVNDKRFYVNKYCELKQRLLHVCHGIDQTIIDNATHESLGVLAHVCGKKVDTSSNYCDNIQPYDKRRFSFCLSNVMHGQNINSPVCVCVCMCVCVSVTLSVNSPTGQTPQRIFTIDSLKDANLRKDVPFGGLDDE